MTHTAVLWLRRDLRLTDNPALTLALADAKHLIPLYIHAPEEEAPWQPGAASRWWLHHSLAALDAQLRRHGSRLIIAHGPSLKTLQQLLSATGATHLYWNRLYEPALIARDQQIKRTLREAGIQCTSTNAALLVEPWTVQTNSGTPFRVFTPYWRAAQRQLVTMPTPTAAPSQLPPVPATLDSLPLESLKLLPKIDWAGGLAATWSPGEAGALAQLDQFIHSAARDYAQQRDFPAKAGTSRLSPFLHFGEIGPRQILHALDQAGIAAEAYERELGWREFNHQLLYHFPQTTDAPLNPRFAQFPWRECAADDPQLQAWQQGRTGFALVDAGMRELWHSGWMHNRVRMLVASFLTKHLRLPWTVGARWFWDTLVDADLANNSQGWQWTAGCGADAAPYFRIFNPVRQIERFDPQWQYIHHWCPEWRTDGTPPPPIVDLAAAREEALAAYRQSADVK